MPPQTKVTMKHVSQEFLSRKKSLAKPLHAISLSQLRNQEIYMVRSEDESQL
jgi:hypothetical protein